MADVMTAGIEFAVDQEWETDLEPGSWYRVVNKARPRIIIGYVFTPKAGDIDYRDVAGKPLSPRTTFEYGKVTRAWEAAVSAFRKETA